MDTLPLAMGSQSEVPVIKPNWNEFKDFKSFIAVVEQQGVHRMGMAKVIPPPEWIVRSDGYDNLNVVIPMPISQKIAGIQGIYQQTITKLQSLTIREFELLANSDKYRTPHYRDFDDLEEMFWKSLLTSQPIYGADVPHSLFDQEQDVWNFQYLDTILDTLAETEDSYDIKGITSPYLYYGMWRSSFAWHTEDMDLYSVNYLHYGAARTWYVIPPEHGKKFEKLAGALFPNVAQNCDAFLRHKTILISPEILQQYSIPVYKVIQEPGEIMISFPYSYRAGFNHGFNCAEAINFATKRWIEYGKRALLCDCSKSLVRFKMDIFVRKYQPENYQRWVTANDRDKHPEAPDENILHPQLLRQMNLHMGVDPNMTNSIKVEGGHISGLGGLGGDELHAAAAAAAAAAVGVGPGSSSGAGGSGTGPLSPTNMTPTTALAAAAVAAASGSTSGTVQTAGALASPSTSGTKGELGNTDVVKVFKQVHTKVIPASVDLYREAQAKGLVGNEPLTRKRSLEAPQQEESYKQLRALEEGADTDGPFKCTTCGVEFLESNQLKNHLRSHSRDKPYWCGYCGKVFSQEQSLKVHLRIHTGEKPYKCDICERQFTQMSSLNRHFRVHTGERPYRCETCGKDFAQPGTLRDHAMTHTGHKPFKCGTCGKGFIQSTAMKTHERTHTGERPYKCGTCGKGFRQSSLLNIHEKTHLAEKPYGCDICSRSFTTKSFLQIHKKTHNQHNLGDLVQKGALGSASNLPPPTAIKQERSTSEADALNVAASALNELQHHVSVSSQRGAAGMGAAAHAAGSNRDLGGDLQIVTRGEALDLHRDLQAHRGNAGGGGGDASTSDHGVLSPTKLPPASSFKHSTLQQVQAMQQQQDMDQTLLTADQVIDQALLARTQEQAALDRVMDRSLYDRTALERTASLALQRVVQPQNLSATSRTLSQDLSQASMTSTGAPDDSHTSPQGGVGVDATAPGVNTSLHEASPLHDRVTVAAGAGAGAPYGLADQANELLHQQHNANQQLQEEEPTAYLAAPSSHAHSVAHTGGLSHSAVVAHSGGVTHTGVSMSDAQLLLDQQTSPHSLVTRNTGGASSVTTSQPGLLNETLSLSQGMHDKTALQYAIAALRDYPEVFQERTTTPGGTSTATIVAANTTGVLQGETLSPTSQSRQEEQHRQLVTSIIRGDNTALHFVTAALRNASGENHGGQHDVGTDLSITATTGAAAGSSASTGGAGNPPQGLPQSEAELKKAALAQAVSALYPQATGQAQQERDLLLPENLTQHQQQHQQLLSINSQMSPNHTGLNPTNPASTPPHDTGREGQEIGSTQVHNAAMAAVSALQMSQQLEQVSALNQAAAMHTSSIQQTILQQAMSLQQAALQEAATIPARSSASPTSQPQ